MLEQIYLALNVAILVLTIIYIVGIRFLKGSKKLTGFTNTFDLIKFQIAITVFLILISIAKLVIAIFVGNQMFLFDMVLIILWIFNMYLSVKNLKATKKIKKELEEWEKEQIERLTVIEDSEE